MATNSETNPTNLQRQYGGGEGLRNYAQSPGLCSAHAADAGARLRQRLNRLSRELPDLDEPDLDEVVRLPRDAGTFVAGCGCP